MSVDLRFFGHIGIVGCESDLSLAIVALDASTYVLTDVTGDYDMTYNGSLNTEYNLLFLHPGYVPEVRAVKPLNQDDTAIRTNTVLTPIAGYVAPVIPVIPAVDVTFDFDSTTRTDVSVWAGASIVDASSLPVADLIYDTTAGSLTFTCLDVTDILDTSVSFTDVFDRLMTELGDFPAAPEGT